MRKDLIKRAFSDPIWFGYDDTWHMRPCSIDDPGVCGIVVRADHETNLDLSQLAPIAVRVSDIIQKSVVLVPLSAKIVDDVTAAILIEASRDMAHVQKPLGTFYANPATGWLEVRK